jgi:hypothetical protein
MTPYTKDYIVPGDVFVDETVLCIRCGVQVMGLSYKEMPKVNRPKEMVNVAHKKKYGNYSLLPVLLCRQGKETIVHLPCCRDCQKEIVPERDTDELVRQIKRAMQMEARYIGLPDETVADIARAWADARFLRKLTPEEVTAGKIMETV